MLTRRDISNWRKLKETSPRNPWNVMKVHRPPIHIHVVNEPWDSGPHRSIRECPMQLDGVDAADVIKLHPSRYDDAIP